jgi:hypothetical protein
MFYHGTRLSLLADMSQMDCVPTARAVRLTSNPAAIILTELDREIADPGWCVCADGLGESQRAMENGDFSIQFG